MTRCLGIDYGAKRWGLAYGDEIGVATPLPALTQPDPAARWTGLGAVVAGRRITDFVLGHPLNMDGTRGAKAREVEAFAERLTAAFGCPVHLVDERLTSYEAEATVPARRRRAIRSTGIVDSRAATLLLQDYLGQRFPLP